MSDLKIGQECELRWRDEAGEFWRRVRVVERPAHSGGTAVWVKYVKSPGNSFPVSREDLRPLAQTKARPALSGGERT